MRITAELSLYPLAGEVETPVWAFIEHIIANNTCSVATNSMSTQITGDSADVCRGVNHRRPDASEGPEEARAYPSDNTEAANAARVERARR